MPYTMPISAVVGGLLGFITGEIAYAIAEGTECSDTTKRIATGLTHTVVSSTVGLALAPFDPIGSGGLTVVTAPLMGLTQGVLRRPDAFGIFEQPS